MKVGPVPAIVLALVFLSLPACGSQAKHDQEIHQVVATNPRAGAITLTVPYVCQIRSHHHITIRAVDHGYLDDVAIKEGQAVKKGDPLFVVIPVVGGEKAELTKAELVAATIKAPFDGIIGGLHCQQGSMVRAGGDLTTLSDNREMWVYFNVPQARYLEFMARPHEIENLQAELVLANGQKFEHPGKLAAVAAEFNDQTGNIPFRADFPNPEGLLRNGQTGTLLIGRVVDDVVVIPQRATFEIMAKGPPKNNFGFCQWRVCWS